MSIWIKCIFSTEFYYAGIRFVNNYGNNQDFIGSTKDLSYLPETINIYGADTTSGTCTVVHQITATNEAFLISASQNKAFERDVEKLKNIKFKTYYISLTYNSNASQMLFGNISFIGIPGTTPIYQQNM